MVRGVIVAAGAAVLVAGCDLGAPADVHSSPSRLVEVGDVNGDGALDVVGVGPGAYQVLLNDGTGDLAGSPVALAGEVVAFALGDLDGDGVVDRVDLNRPASGPATVTLSSGDGAGGFAAPEVAVPGLDAGSTHDVVVGDTDGDGDADLLVARRYGFNVYRNDGTGTFALTGGPGYPCWSDARVEEPFTTTELVFVDRNGDGAGDVVMVGLCDMPWGQDPQIRVAFNEGDGVFGTQFIHGLARVDGLLSGLSVADVDEDGVGDVVVGSSEPSGVLVYRGDARGDIAYDPIVVPTSAPPGDVEVADIDEDGHLDLVATASGTGFGRVFYGDGTGQFPESHVLATGGDAAGPVAVGRIDGDSSPDVVFGNDGDSADPSVAVLLNTLGRRQH